jgi:hypothetical protein
MRHRSPSPISPSPIACEVFVLRADTPEPPVRIPATLRYDPADPIAVTISFRVAEGHTVEWTFARRLLAEGARSPAGLGDVRLRPSFRDGRRVVVLSLSSPSGDAEFDIPASTVTTFLRQSFAAVPESMEAELIDWDGEVDALLHDDVQ